MNRRDFVKRISGIAAAVGAGATVTEPEPEPEVEIAGVRVPHMTIRTVGWIPQRSCNDDFVIYTNDY